MYAQCAHYPFHSQILNFCFSKTSYSCCLFTAENGPTIVAQARLQKATPQKPTSLEPSDSIEKRATNLQSSAAEQTVSTTGTGIVPLLKPQVQARLSGTSSVVHFVGALIQQT